MDAKTRKVLMIVGITVVALSVLSTLGGLALTVAGGVFYVVQQEREEQRARELYDQYHQDE